MCVSLSLQQKPAEWQWQSEGERTHTHTHVKRCFKHAEKWCDHDLHRLECSRMIRIPLYFCFMWKITKSIEITNWTTFSVSLLHYSVASSVKTHVLHCDWNMIQCFPKQFLSDWCSQIDSNESFYVNELIQNNSSPIQLQVQNRVFHIFYIKRYLLKWKMFQCYLIIN